MTYLDRIHSCACVSVCDSVQSNSHQNFTKRLGYVRFNAEKNIQIALNEIELGNKYENICFLQYLQPVFYRNDESAANWFNFKFTKRRTNTNTALTLVCQLLWFHKVCANVMVVGV